MAMMNAFTEPVTVHYGIGLCVKDTWGAVLELGQKKVSTIWNIL